MNKSKHIVITGFMGTGKTTVGREVAGRLGMDFYDTDEIVETRGEMSIPEMFEQFGEGRFRETERAVFRELVDRPGRAVISTGGGTLVSSDFGRPLLDSTVVFCLTSSVDVLMSRIGESLARPLAGPGGSNLERLLARRQSQYAVLPNQIDTSDMTPAEVAEEIIRIYEGAV